MKLNKAKVKATVHIAVLIAICVFLGYLFGFLDATGGIPWLASAGSESVGLPSDITRLTAPEAEQTLEPLHDKTYGEGYNCLDYAWEAMRLLHWNGQLAMIARLDLTPDPDHAVIIVPTTDEGWVFFEPQTGERIYPAPGGKYVNFANIEGVYVMGLSWMPIDVYLLEVAEGLSNTTALSYYAGQ